MKATVLYRGSYWRPQDWTLYTVNVEIGDNCPVCGKRRGEPTETRQHEDGYDFYLSCWSNPCGHVDRYDDVLVEAGYCDKNGVVNEYA